MLGGGEYDGGCWWCGGVRFLVDLFVDGDVCYFFFGLLGGLERFCGYWDKRFLIMGFFDGFSWECCGFDGFLSVNVGL